MTDSREKAEAVQVPEERELARRLNDQAASLDDDIPAHCRDLYREAAAAIVRLPAFNAKAAALAPAIALSASDEACYRWPDDSDWHKQLRAAFVEGTSRAASAKMAVTSASTATDSWPTVLEALACLLDSDDDRGITPAVHKVALHWADALRTVFPAPKIFSHSGDSVVFKWGDRLYFTITDEGALWRELPSGTMSLSAPAAAEVEAMARQCDEAAAIEDDERREWFQRVADLLRRLAPAPTGRRSHEGRS